MRDHERLVGAATAGGNVVVASVSMFSIFPSTSNAKFRLNTAILDSILQQTGPAMLRSTGQAHEHSRGCYTHSHRVAK